jgi:kynurenine formamidase
MVLDARQYGDDQPIGVDILEGCDVRPGMCVLIRTGWAAYWCEDRYFTHPYLSDALAQALVAAGVALVGVDALNIDSTPDAGYSSHAILLGADILVAENLRGLEQLVCGQIYIFAMLPLAVGDLDGAPVRAIAWNPDHRFGV